MDREKRKKLIEALVEEFYREYDFLKEEPYSMLVDKALEMFLDSDLSIEDVKNKMFKMVQKRKLAIEARYNPEEVKENHGIVYGKLDQLTPLLQEAGIDYHLGGALCAYLKYGEESIRSHDDLDFMVNEKDLDKFKEVCEKLGFSFYDHRMDSPRVLKNGIPSGEHEVIATTSVSDFHIGVFCFERLVDGTVILKGYYHDEDGNACCREEILSSELAKEVLNNEVIEYHGHPLSITSPEWIYTLKSYTKTDKDKVDLSFMEDKINQDKLKKLRDLSKTDRYIQCVRVAELPATRTLNPKAMENDNSELSQMLVEAQDSKSEGKEKHEEKEKTKKLGKIDPPTTMSQNGFAHKYTIVISILIATVLILIVLLILKWTQII